MRVALYARVSTKQHGQNPETQLQPLRQFAAQRDYEIVDEYIDLGWSGGKERRPQLDRMMADARKHRFAVVLVWRFDRFARSTRHLIQALEELNRLGIQFTSFCESIDTSTPMGKMMFTIIGAVAEMERSLIRERVLAGVERAKREGKKLGRPTVLVDKQRIRERLAAGESVSSIARAAGIARSTVRAIGRGGEKAKVSSGETMPAVDL